MVNRQFSNSYLRYTNNSCIEEQNNERTEALCRKVKVLKNIVINIREETKRQNVEITKYQQLMNQTNSLISQTHRRISNISQSGNWKIYLYLTLFSLFVFLMIYFFN